MYILVIYEKARVESKKYFNQQISKRRFELIVTFITN